MMQSGKMDAEDNNLASRVASFSYYLKTGDHQENFVQTIGGGLVEEPVSFSATVVSKETKYPSGRMNLKSAALINKPPSSYAINLSNSIDSQQDQRLSVLDDDLPPAENFAFKVKPGAVLQDPKSAAVAAALSRVAAGPTQQVQVVEKMNINPANGEIGVFGADKYFNMKLEPIELPGMKSNYLRPKTPSVYSEASSRDSGTALLKTSSSLARNSVPRSTSKPKIPLGRRIIASFGCTGQCMDSGAVYVAENGRADSQQGQKRTEPFAFPILCSDTQSLSSSSRKKKMEDEKIEELRRSLDVFGSETMKKGDIATNLERKLSVLTWDAIIPKSSSHPPTTTTTVCDDMASDASSDLFEIDNISGNIGGHPILNMQATGGDDDDISGYCTSPTTQCYAPSEASIEWSVVTASAADFSSVISDYDEKYIGLGVGVGVGVRGGEHINSAADATGNKKFIMRSKKAGLLGCNSQKAVNVSDTVHKSRVERY